MTLVKKTLCIISSMLKKIIGNEKFIILDVGGYFSFLINVLIRLFY